MTRCHFLPAELLILSTSEPILQAQTSFALDHLIKHCLQEYALNILAYSEETIDDRSNETNGRLAQPLGCILATRVQSTGRSRVAKWVSSYQPVLYLTILW